MFVRTWSFKKVRFVLKKFLLLDLNRGEGSSVGGREV